MGIQSVVEWSEPSENADTFASAVVKVNGTSVFMTSNVNSKSTTIQFTSSATYIIEVIVTDMVGHSYVTNATVFVDTDAPVLTLTNFDCYDEDTSSFIDVIEVMTIIKKGMRK